MGLLELPTDCDPLVFQFLELRDLLAARSCSGQTLGRYDARRKPLWAPLRPQLPTVIRLMVGAPLSSIQSMCGIFAVTTAELQSWRILDAVCVKGRLDVAQWITNYFNLTDTGLYDDHGIRRTTMYATCVNGHLSTAQWLVNYFGASIAHGSPRYYALRYICENGDLPMAHWFAVQFGITRFEAFRDCAMPLVNACYGNHLMVARWFVWFFEPTSQDLHEVMGLTDILEAICHSDNLAMMKWFVEHFRITEADIRVGGDYVMHCAHTRSCGAIARYLMERFGQVVIDDARVDRLRVEFAAMEYLESQRAKF